MLSQFLTDPSQSSITWAVVPVFFCILASSNMCTVFFTPLWITTTVIRLLSLPVPNRFQNKTMVTLLISNIRSLSMIPIFVHIYIFFCTEPKNDNSSNTDICTAQNKSLVFCVCKAPPLLYGFSKSKWFSLNEQRHRKSLFNLKVLCMVYDTIKALSGISGSNMLTCSMVV